MKNLLLALLLVSSCGGESDPLVGEWVNEGAGLGLTFSADDTYSVVLIQITSVSGSSGTANVDLEGGAYASSATAVTFTPQKATCPGPIPVYTLNYRRSGTSLVMSSSSGAVTFLPNESTGGSTAVITYGCFSGGTFTPHPLGSVTN